MVAEKEEKMRKVKGEAKLKWWSQSAKAEERTQGRGVVTAL